jgi:predicted MFS family arabinose efflux permease
VAVATQAGYTLGILFVLPLGDLVDRRRLSVSLVAVLVLATWACALAPTLHLLIVASVLVGFGATITQVMVPLAADLANDEQRGRAVGVVISGIFGGILLARTISGAIGAAFGWRVTFAVAGVAAIVLGAVLALSLPKLPPKATQRYGALLASMFHLLARHPQLRIACATQACVFGIFSAFWSVLALLLARPPFGYGSAVAGAFGIVGVVGIVAANMSGRLLQRYGNRAGLLAGLCCCVAAYVVFALDVSLRGLIVGVVLLDFGMSIANVANQSLILGLDAAARSRINTVYVTSAFLGGAAGSGGASVAWAHGGWIAVCIFGLGAALLAVGIAVAASRRTGRQA